MRKAVNMISGPILPNVIRFTIPVILTGILQLLFNAADLVVVGRFCGSISVAAVSSTSSITNLMVNFFVGLSVGAGVAVAHGIGGQNPDEVHRTVHTAIPTAIVSGLFLTVVGVSLSGTFLKMMQTPEKVLPLSTVYMQIYFAGVVFAIVYNFCAAILRAAGDTKGPLLFLVIAGIINVILNVVFVICFHMNVAGVALATTISQGISAVLCTIALTRRTDACRLNFRKMHFYRPQLKKIIVIGLPAGIQSTLFSISNVLIQSSVNSFGSEILMSGNGAASNLEGFVYTTMNSFHQTAVNFIGQNTGAQRYDRIKRIFFTCLGSVAVVGLVAGVTVYSFGPQLLSIYITDSAEAISYGCIRLSFICFPYFLCGLMDTATGALRGLGASIVPMIVSIVGIVGVRILWIYTIFRQPALHTPNVLYMSYPISWILTFLIQFGLFIWLYQRMLRRANPGTLNA